MTETLMTAAEVVQKLRIESRNPARTLAYYRDQGKLRGVRIGKQFKYRPVDIDNFIRRTMRIN